MRWFTGILWTIFGCKISRQQYLVPFPIADTRTAAAEVVAEPRTGDSAGKFISLHVWKSLLLAKIKSMKKHNCKLYSILPWNGQNYLLLFGFWVANMFCPSWQNAESLLISPARTGVSASISGVMNMAGGGSLVTHTHNFACSDMTSQLFTINLWPLWKLLKWKSSNGMI